MMINNKITKLEKKKKLTKIKKLNFSNHHKEIKPQQHLKNL